MILKSLRAVHFRNLKELELTPGEGVNIICGNNAQGKTNLLEAIWQFTGAKSFRGNKDREQIGFDKPYCRSEITFTQNGRLQTSSIAISDKKVVTLNDVTLKNAAELAGRFACVIFSPDHLSIIKDGPAVRRLFLDTAICQAKPAYVGLLYRMKKVLGQKNALLKDIKKNADLYDLLDVYDNQLAVFSDRINQYRRSFLSDLSPVCRQLYGGLSGGKEQLEVTLSGSFSQDDTEDSIFEKLKAARPDDLRFGYSTIGCHRDDLQFFINGLNAKTYGSQGQQRSVALTLKLAEGRLMKKYLGEDPIMLLDDVMSELDENRQDFIRNQLGSGQVFITCCDDSQISRLIRGNTYYMNSGVLQSCTFT